MLKLYGQMLELAIANGLPLSHKNDLLLHDKRRLQEHPGKPFVWLLYECGTHLFLLDKEDCEGVVEQLERVEGNWMVVQAMAYIVESIDKTFGHGPRNDVPASKWFYSDGETIGAATPKPKAVKQRCTVLRQWRDLRTKLRCNLDAEHNGNCDFGWGR